MADSTAPVQSGEVIAGKYLVDRVLGQGGMGVVVAASHTTLNQRVALKFLLPEACQHDGAVERFLREARAAVRIQSEHVARVTDVGTLETGSPYMVMEFLEGHDLAHEIEERTVLLPAEIAQYLLQACEALAEAHALGIVHRDLKPANLFLSERKDGTRVVKVLDFGISKAVQEGEVNLTQTASMMGSPLYMAPEQIRSARSVDARADVWSLGVILHESLAGAVPFGGDTLSGVLAAIVADPPRPLAEMRPDLPPAFGELVARCLQKDPTQRVQNVAELAELLEPFAPVQAARSLPRIRAILGQAPRAAVTAPAGTPTAVSGDVLAATALGSTASTAPAWSKTELPLHGGPRGRRLIALVAGGVLALVGAGIVWSVSRPSEPVQEAQAELPASALPVSAASPPSTPPPSAPPTEEAPASTAPAAVTTPEEPPGVAASPSSTPALPVPGPKPKAKPVATAQQAQQAASPAAAVSTPKPAVSTPKPAPAAPAANPLDGRR